MKRLVLLGGGHAHLQVLRALAREPLAQTGVTLVSPYPKLVYSGMVPGMVAGHYAADECTIALAPLAVRAGLRFIERAATGLDAAARRLRLSDGSDLAYDVLSIDIGSVMPREAIEGASEHALFVRPIEYFMPRSATVVGGGAAGVELALALQFRFGAGSRVSLLSGDLPLLGAYPARVREFGRRALKRSGIALHEQGCVQVAADHIVLASGERLACDLALLAIGGSAPRWLAASGLALDAQGFVATGETLQSSSHAEVFAAGDVASRIDVPRPRSGVYAVRAGPPLALNLRRFIDGAALQRYRPQARSLNLLACGEQRAIVSWGPLAAEGRWAWHWKDRIDRRFVAAFKDAPR
jgi:selenide,water dikinase